MIGKVSFQLNETTYEFTLDKGDDLSILNQIITLGNPPRKCKEVTNGFYRLETNKDKDGNIYINMVCYGQGKNYKSKLGSYKDKSGFFWHNWAIDEFAMKRIGAESKDTPNPVAPPATKPPVVAKNETVEEEMENIPF